MSNYHSDNGGSGRNTALIIVGIIGGVVVVFLLVCGGIAFLAVRAFRETVQPMMEKAEQALLEMQQSQVVANDFVENIRANKLDAAYQATTAGFQKRMSRKAFEELVQKHPELKQPADFQGPDMNQPPAKPQAQPQAPMQPFSGPYRYRYSVRGKDDKDSAEFSVTVVNENGALKVDQLTVYKAEGSK